MVGLEKKLTLYGFNNLTKTLSFNIFDVCYAKSEREKRDYIRYIDEQYNSERLTNILCDVTEMIGAAVLNISRQAYSNYETSKRTPDLDSLMRLADIYGVSLDQLVNHPCTKDGLILEQKGPFTYAMEIDTADTLYLTREEVELIKGYRAMNPEDKLLLKKLL